MDLHQAGKRSEWSHVTSSKRNVWQKLAVKTHGLLTPGNLLSIGGASILLVGLVLLQKGSLGPGLALVAVGRLADIADGIVAARTGTKSPFGEALDAVIDKLVLLATAVTLLLTELVPWLVVVVFVFFNAVNVASSALAKTQGAKLHPSKFGKLAAALQWVTLVLFLLSALLASYGSGMAATIVAVLAWISFINAFVLSGIAALGYIFKMIAIKVYHGRV